MNFPKCNWTLDSLCQLFPTHLNKDNLPVGCHICGCDYEKNNNGDISYNSANEHLMSKFHHFMMYHAATGLVMPSKLFEEIVKAGEVFYLFKEHHQRICKIQTTSINKRKVTVNIVADQEEEEDEAQKVKKKACLNEVPSQQQQVRTVQNVNNKQAKQSTSSSC